MLVNCPFDVKSINHKAQEYIKRIIGGGYMSEIKFWFLVFRKWIF